MWNRIIALGQVLAAAAAIVAAVTSGAYAQRNRGGGQGNPQYDPGPQKAKYDGRWAFVRLRYNQGMGRGGPSWAHDWPWGEQHFLQILDFVTNIDARQDTTLILNLDDPEIFKYPIVYLCEPGFWTVNDKEAANLRAYLQKGGLIIFDDFHSIDRAAGGGDDWPYFEQAMKTVLPDAKIMDLDIKNTLFHAFFDVPSFDVVHNMYDPGAPVFRGIYEDNDPKKRLLAIINYNTDISEYWEYSASGFNPVSDTNQAYQIGVNWIIYGMTH
jgi:hypothetical protein